LVTRNQARALVASPAKNLRASDTAEESITEALKLMSPDVRTDRNKRHVAHRQLESDIVLSQIWFDRDYYPIATSLAQDALTIGAELGSSIYVPFVDRIHVNLKSSSYGSDTEVAKLGIQLAKSKYARILND
jgi:hypothetical protein